MEKKAYFDEEMFNIAISKENLDPYGTCQILERYCSKYPNDRIALRDYARVLITVGRLDDAERVLNKLANLIASARKKKKDEIEKDEDYLRFTTLKFLAWQKKYEEALCYLEKYKESIKRTNENIDVIEYYCKHKLGLLPKTYYNRSTLHYKDRQIADYQESDCLNHIKMKHLKQSMNHQESIECEGSFFENDFPFDIIYQAVKEIIRKFQLTSNQEAKRLNSNFPINIYAFRYPKCGRNNGQIVDCFVVAVLHDTDNIITMYPSAKYDKLPHFDLSHMVPSCKTTEHTRTRSARFYSRYGIQK